MLNARFRPLDRWPGDRTRSRKDAQFRASYPKTLDLLEYELGWIRARDVIIQVDNLTLNDIRNDGWPKSSWCPRGGNQGVVVSFESPKGAMSFPCDRFREWQDNLRAVAKSLEALRMVDRYGVTRGSEQYQGFARLEAPSNGNNMDRDKALAFLALLSGVHADRLARYRRDDLAGMIRAQRILHHPDRASDEQDRARRAELSAKLGQAEHALTEGGS